MKTILLDCDGVLADFTGAMLATLNDRHGTQHVKADVTDWDMGAALGVGMTEICEIANTPSFCRDLPVLPGAQEAVYRLRARYDVIVVTSPMAGPFWCYERYAWLRENFGFSMKNVIHAASKHHVAGDILIDDRDKNVLTWTGRWNKIGLLWDAPYNRASELSESIIRVPSWDIVLETIEAISMFTNESYGQMIKERHGI